MECLLNRDIIPVGSKLRTRGFIVRRIVTNSTNWGDLDKRPFDRGIEGIPSTLTWPAIIFRQTTAVSCYCTCSRREDGDRHTERPHFVFEQHCCLWRRAIFSNEWEDEDEEEHVSICKCNLVTIHPRESPAKASVATTRRPCAPELGVQLSWRPELRTIEKVTSSLQKATRGAFGWRLDLPHRVANVTVCWSSCMLGWTVWLISIPRGK